MVYASKTSSTRMGAKAKKKIGRPVEITNKMIEDTLKKCKGRVFSAAKRLGCDPSTIHRRMQEFPYLRQLAEGFRGLLIDTAQEKLEKSVDRGDPWAVRFVLTTLGRDRGFVTQTDLRIGGDENAPPIQHEVYINPDELPLEVKKALLAHIRQKKAEKEVAEKIPQISFKPTNQEKAA